MAEKEYNSWVKPEDRPTNRIEKLIGTARGHEDNRATHVARRVLNKRGINW